MTELRTAIVGSGFVARVHAAAVRDLGGTVVAVCSRTTSGAEALAAEIEGSVSAYDSLAELLVEGGVDVVHVCTPNALHAEQTLLALEHGAHVVCEKPLATSVEESASMLAGTRGKRPRGRRRLPRAGLPARRAHARRRRGGRPGGAARRARALRLRRRAPGHDRLAPRTAELRPDLRDGRPRRALVRPRRARHQRPDRGSARRFPDVRAGQGARRPCNAAAPVRQRRHRQRHLQRVGPRTQEPAAVRARGQPRRLHLGPGIAERATAPPRRRRRPRWSSRTPGRTPAARRSSRAIRPATQKATAMRFA